MMNSPAQIAESTVEIGKKKTELSVLKMLILGFFAGMFIAFGAVAANTVSCLIPNAGVAKLLGALVFPAGLAMVLIAGAELFTGNCLILVGVLDKKVKLTAMLKNWLFVYIGNFIGGLFTAGMMTLGHQFGLFNGNLAVTTIKVATSKCSLDFWDALILAIFCNILVCIAVWMSFGAKSVSGKIVALYLPIMAFVLCGFEHSVANMYYIPAGLFAKLNPAYAELAVQSGIDLSKLSWGNFFVNNLIPVTIGNIIGGAVIVGGLYFLVYLKKNKK